MRHLKGPMSGQALSVGVRNDHIVTMSADEPAPVPTRACHYTCGWTSKTTSGSFDPTISPREYNFACSTIKGYQNRTQMSSAEPTSLGKYLR